MARRVTKTTYIIAFWVAGVACSFTSNLLYVFVPFFELIDNAHVAVAAMFAAMCLANIIGFVVTLELFKQLNPSKMLPWIALYGLVEALFVRSVFDKTGLENFSLFSGCVATVILCVTVLMVFRDRV